VKLLEMVSSQRVGALTHENKVMALRNEVQFNQQALALFDLKRLDEVKDIAVLGQLFRSCVYDELLLSGFDFGQLPTPMSERLSSVYTRLEVLRVYFKLRSEGKTAGLKAVRAKLRLENLDEDLGQIAMALKGTTTKQKK
jgi:hypothetical protein